MNSESFFENFELLAESPNGIKMLREMILQMAVQGKLVEQDASDETAEVLLEKIRVEKARLVKKGKIRKSKALSSIEESEILHDIPSNWTWVKIGEIADYNGTDNVQSENISEDAWLLDLADIEKDSSKILQRALFKERKSKSTKSHFKAGDILYGKLRPYLNKVVVADEDGYCTTEIVPIRIYCGVDSKYLMYALKRPDFLDYVNSKTYGVKMPRLGTDDAINALVPLPPLEEQKRIVAKVDQLMILCDQLESFQQTKNKSCIQLNNSALSKMLDAGSPDEFAEHWQLVCENFDLLYDNPDNVKALKQVILQLAMQGKLVEQDENDAPVEVLLEKIKVEKERLVKEGKIKKIYKSPEIEKSENPYEIPDNWKWIRFGEVATIESNLVKPSMYLDLPHVAPNNIEKGTGKLLEYTTIREDGVTSPKHYFYPGQLLYSKIRPNLSKVVIIDFEGLCSADMYPIRSHIETRYLHLYFLSEMFLNQVISDDNRVAMPKVNQQQLVTILVPLPPLEEQKCIVAKVDKFMALCDQLEAKIRQAQSDSDVLMEVSLKKVLGEG